MDGTVMERGYLLARAVPYTQQAMTAVCKEQTLDVLFPTFRAQKMTRQTFSTVSKTILSLTVKSLHRMFYAMHSLRTCGATELICVSYRCC